MENSESDVLAYMDFPPESLEQDIQHQPIGTPEQGGETSQCRCWHIPLRGIHSAAHWIGAHGTKRRVAAQDRYMPKASLERLTGTAKELAKK